LRKGYGLLAPGSEICNRLPINTGLNHALRPAAHRPPLGGPALAPQGAQITASLEHSAIGRDRRGTRSGVAGSSRVHRQHVHRTPSPKGARNSAIRFSLSRAVVDAGGAGSLPRTTDRPRARIVCTKASRSAVSDPRAVGTKRRRSTGSAVCKDQAMLQSRSTSVRTTAAVVPTVDTVTCRGAILSPR